MSIFTNRWSRCKELGKKVPQAYRVYVEDTFLPCDAADARIFVKENFLSLYNALHNTELKDTEQLKNIRTASLMKREAFDINMIEKMTGLSKKEIENL